MKFGVHKFVWKKSEAREHIPNSSLTLLSVLRWTSTCSTPSHDIWPPSTSSRFLGGLNMCLNLRQSLTCLKAHKHQKPKYSFVFLEMSQEYQASSCFLINRFLWHSAKGPSRKAKLSFIVAVYDQSDQPFVGAAVLPWHPVNFAIAKLLCVVLQKLVAKGSMHLKVLKWIQSCKVKKH